MTLKTVSLDDKYMLTEGRIFITGTQALVRLPLTQQQRDGRENSRLGKPARRAHDIRQPAPS